MTEHQDITHRADGMTQVAGSFAFEVKSAPGGLVRTTCINDHEYAAGVYQSFQYLTLEVNAGRWLPILREMVRKCEEVVTLASVAAINRELAEKIEEHGAAT